MRAAKVLFDDPAVLSFKGSQASVEELSFRHDNDIVPWSDLVTTENLSNQSFRAIPRDGAPQLFRGRYTQPARGGVAWQKEDREIPAVRPDAPVIDQLEVGATAYPLVGPQASHDSRACAPIRC
jgi:hypothetical protein